PELARPGEPYKITYKGNKPGKAVIFAIDEGILQVAGYSTPDPLAFFFKKRALEVRTAQILDLLLPELAMVKASSHGGAEEGYGAIGKNLNPFKRKRDKPVAYWSGIVDIDGTERTLTYDVPDSSNGSMRLMAVDGTSRTEKVSEGREGSVTFKLRAKRSLGSANLTFLASWKDKKSKQSIDLSVRPPTPYLTTVSTGGLKDRKAEIPVARRMYKE